MWKIRGRNFPILLEMMKVFEQIKSTKNKNNENDLFIFEHEKYYNIKYINEKTNTDIKFEVFKILVYQILYKIKEIRIQLEKNENILLLERNPSNVSDIDYKEIFNIIMSNFVDIKPECAYYYDLTLFYYKNFLNSKIFFNFIISNYPNIISKIMKIIFDNKEDINKDNDKREKFTKLIMLKLFSQILENINEEEEICDFGECINLYEKSNLKNENPFIYLYEKIIKELNHNIKNKIIVNYYNKLLSICLNKISNIEENEELIKSLVKNDISYIILLFFSDKSSEICEKKFIQKSKILKNFENEALFNSEKEESNKTGKIICFVDFKEFVSNPNDDNMDDYQDNTNNSQFLRQYLKNDSIIYFDKSIIKYYKKNKNNFKNVFVVMDDIIESESYKSSNVEIKSFSNIRIIEEDNNYQMKFIKNYPNLIIDIIKNEIKNDSLNEKGIYFMLKIMSNLINYSNKEDILTFFKFIWNFYIYNMKEENKYAFMTLEFIEDIMNKHLNIYNFCNKNIYKKDGDDVKSLYNLFKFYIRNKSLLIYSKSNNQIISYKECLQLPILEIN